MAGTLRVGGKVLATHNSETDEVSLDSATNTSNMSFDANHAGIKAALNASGDAPIYACRAWVNFDGTTNTAGYCTIRDSRNVSSIVDRGTGFYRITFTTAMPDINYCVQATSGQHRNATSTNRSIGLYGTGDTTYESNMSTTDFSLSIKNSNAGDNDQDVVCASVFR